MFQISSIFVYVLDFLSLLHVYYLYVEDKSIRCDNFVFNPTSCFIYNKIILNFTHIPPFFLTFCSHIYFQWTVLIMLFLFFPLFNVFVSISIQSYGNSSLHIPTLYTPICKHVQQVWKMEVIQCHKRMWTNKPNMISKGTKKQVWTERGRG